MGRGSQVGVTHQIAVHLGGTFRSVPLNAGKKKRRPRWVGEDSSGTPLFRITRILYKGAEKDSSDSCTKCGYTGPPFSCSKQTRPVGRSMAYQGRAFRWADGQIAHTTAQKVWRSGLFVRNDKYSSERLLTKSIEKTIGGGG